MATVKELKAQAKAKGIKGYSTMRKAELEKALGGSEPKPPPKPPRLKTKAQQAMNPVKRVQPPKKKAPEKKAPAKKAPAKKAPKPATPKPATPKPETPKPALLALPAPPPKKGKPKGGFKVALSKLTNSQKGADYIVSLSRTGRVKSIGKSLGNWEFTHLPVGSRRPELYKIYMPDLKRELQKIYKGEESFGVAVRSLAFLTDRQPVLELEESKKFLQSKYPELVGLPAKYGKYSSLDGVEVGKYEVVGVGLNIQPFIRKQEDGEMKIVGRAPMNLYRNPQIGAMLKKK